MRAHKDALAVQDASNVSGVTHSFLDAIREIRDAGERTENHPALKLFLHQMVFLVTRKELLGMDEYHEATEACRKARETTEAK